MGSAHIFSIVWFLGGIGSNGAFSALNQLATMDAGNRGPFIPLTPDVNISLPASYSRLAIPSDPKGPSYIHVTLYLLIHEVDVDIKTERVKLDADMVVVWTDMKLNQHIMNDEKKQKLLREAGIVNKFIDPDFLHHIWSPDVSFHELATLEKHNERSQKFSLTLWLSKMAPGTFTLWERKIFDLHCGMDFTYFPADTQRCVFNLASYRYPENDLVVDWGTNKMWRAVYLNSNQDPNFQFQVSNVEPGNNHSHYQLNFRTGLQFSAVTFTLQIRRNLNYHLIETYLPSILLVSIAGLGLSLPPDMVEARIGVSMTTLLTLTSMFSTIRETSPEVSYTMAIDIWMIFCIFIVFLSLVSSTVIYWVRRKLVKRGHGDVESRGSMKRQRLRFFGRRGAYVVNKVGKVGSTGSRANNCGTWVKQRTLCGTLVQLTSRGYSIIVFTLVSLAFIVIYSTWVFVGSDYCIWKPNPVYNEEKENVGLYQFVFDPNVVTSLNKTTRLRLQHVEQE